ncbi:hypothetical protein DEO72_LG11g1420 [Vigna unguiculata]|uniref:Transmembrane protein n=1 Tax=Vigna unguiculata TaxID=3917 RepID=A0A4D6NKW3_VIGUN|nr:hypothetical protein DEO72_LG11g1420 [Vigna unguiculata]
MKVEKLGDWLFEVVSLWICGRKRHKCGRRIVTCTPARLEGEIVTGFVAGTVMIWVVYMGAIWGSRSGHQFVVLQVRGRLVLCMDGDLSLMVARRVDGGSVKKLVIAKEVVSQFGGGDAI